MTDHSAGPTSGLPALWSCSDTNRTRRPWISNKYGRVSRRANGSNAVGWIQGGEGRNNGSKGAHRMSCSTRSSPGASVCAPLQHGRPAHRTRAQLAEYISTRCRCVPAENCSSTCRSGGNAGRFCDRMIPPHQPLRYAGAAALHRARYRAGCHLVFWCVCHQSTNDSHLHLMVFVLVVQCSGWWDKVLRRHVNPDFLQQVLSGSR